MMSFKKGLRVYTTSNAINDALMIDFASQNGPTIAPKSLPKRFQKALEGALDEDSVLNLKKDAAESTGTPPAQQRMIQIGRFWPQ